MTNKHHEISLVPTVTQILASMTLRYLIPTRESNALEQYAGFCPGGDSVEQIFTPVTCDVSYRHKHTHTKSSGSRVCPQLKMNLRFNRPSYAFQCCSVSVPVWTTTKILSTCSGSGYQLAALSTQTKKERRTIKDRLQIVNRGPMQKFRMQELCNWAISRFVSNHCFGKSNGTQPGSLTASKRASPLVSVSAFPPRYQTPFSNRLPTAASLDKQITRRRALYDHAQNMF